MCNSWNFNGYIGVPLERDVLKICNYRIDSDEIECGRFAEAMLMVLQTLYADKRDYELFSIACNDIDNLPFSRIVKEKAIELFNEYLELKNRATKNKKGE